MPARSATVRAPEAPPRVWNGSAIASQIELTGDLQSDALQGISSFGEDDNGELYVVDDAGSVYRIDAE